jgi:phosphopantothenate-cysteine ligase
MVEREQFFKSANYMVDLVCILSRGTYQPYFKSLPEDPLVECFEVTDESNIQGLFLLATENMHV